MNQLDAKQKFKIEFFNYIIYVTLNSLEERFNQLSFHSDVLQISIDIDINNVSDILH